MNLRVSKNSRILGGLVLLQDYCGTALSNVNTLEKLGVLKTLKPRSVLGVGRCARRRF